MLRGGAGFGGFGLSVEGFWARILGPGGVGVWRMLGVCGFGGS